MRNTLLLLCIAGFISLFNAQNSSTDTLRLVTRITLRSGNAVTVTVLKVTAESVLAKDINGQELTIEKKKIESQQIIDDRTYCMVSTNTGAVINGYFMGMTKETLIIKTEEMGKVNVPLSTITTVKYIDGKDIQEGKYIFPNPHQTRYFFAPSALQLKKGEGFYHNAMLLSNSFHYGLTDHFSMGGGAIVPFFVYITPKFGYSLHEYFHVGGGVLAGFSPLVFNIHLFTAYGSITAGGSNNNITANIGYAATGGQSLQRPVLNFNGMIRVGRKVCLITENWFIPGKESSFNTVSQVTTERWKYAVNLSGGLRIMGEKHAFDLGLVKISAGNDSFTIPYVAYAFKI